jgi:hypothetical protein
VKSNDGSAIAIQTAKGAYTAGEMVAGAIVLQNNSPRQIDRVLLRVTVQERTLWDEEVTKQATVPAHVREDITRRINLEGGSDADKMMKVMGEINAWECVNALDASMRAWGGG